METKDGKWFVEIREAVTGFALVKGHEFDSMKDAQKWIRKTKFGKLTIMAQPISQKYKEHYYG